MRVIVGEPSSQAPPAEESVSETGASRAEPIVRLGQGRSVRPRGHRQHLPGRQGTDCLVCVTGICRFYMIWRLFCKGVRRRGGVGIGVVEVYV